jgi:site-specific DNA recombinase
VNDAPEPLRAAAYQRISEVLRAGDEHGVTNQRTDQQRTADARGYRIVISEADNDISAFTGKHRPGYERVMAAAARGEIDVILVFQTSRFWRNRSERATAIEVLRKAGVSIIATRGPSLDLSTAYGRAMAGLLGEFDTMESEVKAERQQLANYHAAATGQPRKGTPRPFGWLPDRIHADPAEAEAIAAGCRAILAGGTLTGVARDWERRGVRPHQAPYGPLREYPWTRSSVREILANPRIAGISVYKGEEQGRGQWEPLMAEETWRAVAEILRNPRFRRPYPQGAGSLLGGVAFCRCGNYVTGSSSANGFPAYRCNLETRNYRPGPHVAVKREKVDEHIAMAVIDALSAPDAIHLLTPQAAGDVTALTDEEAVLRNRLSRLGSLFAEGQISETDLTGGRARGEARLAEIAAELAGLGRENVLAPLITARDVAAAWEGLGLDLRRAVVDALMTVTLYPSGRGARRFDPGKVLPPGQGIAWKG